MKTLLIVEDEPEIQNLIGTIFSMDDRFAVAGLADSAEIAVTMALKAKPEIIVLDDRLNGEMRGVDAVATLKAVAPDAKIILFTAYPELRARIDGEPTIDAFLLKTEAGELLPLAQQLTNMLSLM